MDLQRAAAGVAKVVLGEVAKTMPSGGEWLHEGSLSIFVGRHGAMNPAEGYAATRRRSWPWASRPRDRAACAVLVVDFETVVYSDYSPRDAIVCAGGRQEDAMSIIRLIHIKIDPSETETAERIWKTECATLMISQKGCISEKLLRARERGEFISYSEWETEADIERYTNSAAHKQIVSHTRSVKGASAVVKLYDLVN
jgi:heme-degrading monooxygenase HmoA